MKIEEFFDAIYCINLDERTDRWETAQKEFQKLGITNAQRFSAVKHDKGALGCRESHIGVVTDAKKNGYKNILVFEDDLMVIGEDIARIETALDELGTLDWDMFYFGATVMLGHGKCTPVTPNIVRTNFAYTTHAYGMDSNVFDLVIEQAPFHPIIDVFYQNFLTQRRDKSFIINPMLCIQQPSYSDIEKTHVDYSWMTRFFNQALTKK